MEQSFSEKVSRAIEKIKNRGNILDDESADLALKELCQALMTADVNLKLITNLRKNIRKVIEEDYSSPSLKDKNPEKILKDAVRKELIKLIDPGIVIEEFKKSECNIVMFVGIQGSGKTTTCTKFANYYKKKGYEVGVICADTCRPGAFAQTEQNAKKASVLFFGIENEKDPIKIAQIGIKKLKEAGAEIIIVDTSGRAAQDEQLFEQMKKIHQEINPNRTIFIIDGLIGQAVARQIDAFNKAITIDSIILTKMDGSARGGGALSAIAATKKSISFIGTGEHINDFQKFSPIDYVNSLLGYGDLHGIFDKINTKKLENLTGAFSNLISNKKLTLNDIKAHYSFISDLGPIDKIFNMLPKALSNNINKILSNENSNGLNFEVQKSMLVLNALTKKELETDGSKIIKNQKRLEKIAIGTGLPLKTVIYIINSCKETAKTAKSLLGSQNLQNLLASNNDLDFQNLLPKSLNIDLKDFNFNDIISKFQDFKF